MQNGSLVYLEKHSATNRETIGSTPIGTTKRHLGRDGLGRGLQNLLRQFESDRCLKKLFDLNYIVIFIIMKIIKKVMKKTVLVIGCIMIAVVPMAVGNRIHKISIEKEDESNVYHVKATMYTINPAQTDSTPLVTASGYKLHPSNPKKHRIIAVSRDLKKKFKFGEKVRVEGIGKKSGIYTVRDVMNKRWKNKIDILINPGEKAISYNKARLYKIKNGV